MTESSSSSNATLTQWVHEFGDGLFSWAVYKVKDKSKAEDLVQDTFVAALSGIDSFQGKSSPKTWFAQH